MTTAHTQARARSAVLARLRAGAGWGALATLVMSAVMIIGVLSGVAPMPKPIPAALIAHTFGPAPQPALLGLAFAAHLGYGVGAGALLALALPRAALWHGLAYGAVLWLIMGVAWLPYLGWGLFGTAVTPAVALATLLLHLLYGGTLGALLRRTANHPDRLP